MLLSWIWNDFLRVKELGAEEPEMGAGGGERRQRPPELDYHMNGNQDEEDEDEDLALLQSRNVTARVVVAVKT